MQVLHPFDIDIISVRENLWEEYGGIGGSEGLPAFEIFGTIATRTLSAYSLGHPYDAERSRQSWYFDAIMVVHPEDGRFFSRVGLAGGGGPDYFRDIIATHLKQLDLTGCCDTLLPVSETEEKTYE